jgi:hypothetical protein
MTEATSGEIEWFYWKNILNSFKERHGIEAFVPLPRPVLLRLRLDAAVDVPLPGDREQGVGHPVELETSGVERGHLD